MNLKSNNSSLKILFGSIVLATMIVLAYTVLRSGYFFGFDIDELYHANTVYLIAHGYQPFKDFFLPYSPLFHILLIPFYNAFGFNLETIQGTRIIMIALFVLRIVGISLVVRMLFGSLAALLFVPLYLLDPLTEYTSMQIRPDNVMVTVYILGLVFLTRGVIHNKKFLLFLSGIFLSLSLLISIKILPSIAPIFLIVLFLRGKLKLTGIIEFFFGFMLPLVLFGLYYWSLGLFTSMITNLVFDARAINEALKYPVPLGNFYWPSPATTYGLSFKPLLFQYIWSLPLVAFAGAYTTFFSFSTPSKLSQKQTLGIMLALCLIAQWLSLFFIRSVFIQYYIPVTWLFGVFAAVTLAKLLHAFEGNTLLYWGLVLTFGCIYTLYLIPSLQANNERAQVTGGDQKANITSVWKHIPETKAVYPGMLFRPLAYPIPYGFTFWDLPNKLFARYEPIEHYLQKNNVEYLNIGENKQWSLPNESLRQFVTTSYTENKDFPLLWIKK